MKIVLCLDDNNGMLFNNRRQSRDKTVVEDVVSLARQEELFIAPFSQELFKDYADRVKIDGDFLKNAPNDAVCFVEDRLLSGVENITEITVYRWNRVYPSDFCCDVDFSKFSLVSETEFKGNSHSVITKQIFKR